MSVIVEYIWIDGTQPSAQLRSKTRVIDNPPERFRRALTGRARFLMEDLPTWDADGSSTNQATGDSSDIELRPVSAVLDPFRTGVLVLCEVFNADGTPHSSNTRARLRKVLERGAAEQQSWFGFEQEYTFMRLNGQPAGFPKEGDPAPQGSYYCGVGASNIKGRPVYEEILQKCLVAGLKVSGANWEVMPGQAEIQVGAAKDLVACDHLWFARWIMARAAEKYGIDVSFDPKPAEGDWNGAGMHTNFSTQTMREPGGLETIELTCELFAKKIKEHLEDYGAGYKRRLTGAHETARYDEFSWGVSDRTASVRIPLRVARDGYGYMEDRRPNANADPYRVAARILETVCDLD